MTEDQKAEFIAKLLIGKKKGGTITEWAKIGNTIVGNLTGDRYEPIKTSKVIKIHTIENQLVAETLNSYYYLLEESTEYDFYTNLNEYKIKKATEMSNTTTSCFCVGKQSGCTCGGACRCACTCSSIKDKDFSEFSDWVVKIETKEDRDKLILPPNCS